MRVSLIVAMDAEHGIGHGNQLPWRLSTDQRRFKTLTMGHHILMGRNTWESIGRALPGRKSVVISRQPGYIADDCHVVQSLEQGLVYAADHGEDEAFVIGGAQIYALALPYSDRIYLTHVHTSGEADVFFPELNDGDWSVVEEAFFPATEKDEFPTTYQVLDRIQADQKQ
jgi:dihydrofolate reductase